MLKKGVNLHSATEAMTRLRVGVCLITGICLFVSIVFLAKAQNYALVPRTIQKGNVMSGHASGTFEVKLTPHMSKENDEEANLVKLSIDKQFHGDLTAISKGEMLANNMGDKGSGGYVAMERVSGTLHGHRGTFVLQHSGTMTRGATQLSITVVPESGTGQLVGLEGKMTIKVVNGKHSYDFEYTLTETPERKAND
jgi:hypothetical protein